MVTKVAGNLLGLFCPRRSRVKQSASLSEATHNLCVPSVVIGRGLECGGVNEMEFATN